MKLIILIFIALLIELPACDTALNKINNNEKAIIIGFPDDDVKYATCIENNVLTILITSASYYFKNCEDNPKYYKITNGISEPLFNYVTQVMFCNGYYLNGIFMEPPESPHWKCGGHYPDLGCDVFSCESINNLKVIIPLHEYEVIGAKEPPSNYTYPTYFATRPLTIPDVISKRFYGDLLFELTYRKDSQCSDLSENGKVTKTFIISTQDQ